MTNEAKKTILCILRVLETKASLVSKKYQSEEKKTPNKKIRLYRWDIQHCKILFGNELAELLGLIKHRGILSNFEHVYDELGGHDNYYAINLAQNFRFKFAEFKKSLIVPEIPKNPRVLQEFSWVINSIEEQRQRTPIGEPIYYTTSNLIASGVPSEQQEKAILRKLEQFDLIKILEQEERLGMVNLENGVYINILEEDEFIKFHDNIQDVVKKFLPDNQGSNAVKKVKNKKFCIIIKDREIWVNDYLLSKPHGAGNNLAFFESVRKEKINTKFTKNKLPKALKNEIETRPFHNMLNGLGFKGTTKKAFFKKVSTTSLYYRGDEITEKKLIELGIKMPVFLKELELAHTKNTT